MKRFVNMLAAGALLLASAAAFAADPLVDVDWVKANIGKPDVVFLDVRGKLAGRSKTDYLRAHIPGAIYTDYLKDGWRIKNKEGTVGMLPPAENLAKLIGGLGIGNGDHVVIVPEGAKALDMGTATRVYWTFKVVGHDEVSILNGGMAAYTKEVDEKTKQPVNPLEKGAVTREAKTFEVSLREEMIVSKDDVKASLGGGTVLVDNRPNDQYVGVNRHGKSKRSGTIPGSLNLPENWLTMNGGGTFRPTGELQQLYAAAGVPTEGDQISFCNTGHWASLGWFASHEILGNDQARMYDGSMVEWSADESLTMDQKIKLQ
jgi:thiosulfate/3-mercaptopyruvate sulfurtransferase